MYPDAHLPREGLVGVLGKPCLNFLQSSSVRQTLGTLFLISLPPSARYGHRHGLRQHLLEFPTRLPRRETMFLQPFSPQLPGPVLGLGQDQASGAGASCERLGSHAYFWQHLFPPDRRSTAACGMSSKQECRIDSVYVGVWQRPLGSTAERYASSEGHSIVTAYAHAYAYGNCPVHLVPGAPLQSSFPPSTPVSSAPAGPISRTARCTEAPGRCTSARARHQVHIRRPSCLLLSSTGQA